MHEAAAGLGNRNLARGVALGEIRRHVVVKAGKHEGRRALGRVRPGELGIEVRRADGRAVLSDSAPGKGFRNEIALFEVVGSDFHRVLLHVRSRPERAASSIYIITFGPRPQSRALGLVGASTISPKVEAEGRRSVIDERDAHVRAEFACGAGQPLAPERRHKRIEGGKALFGRRSSGEARRLPDIVSAASVNCETQSTSPPTSTTLLFILPASSSKMRSLAVLRASFPMTAGVSPGSPHTSAKKPAADGPGHASFNAHRGFGHSLDQNDHDPLLRRS